MQKFLQLLHSKIGDFWWYSLLLFIALRATDVINAFVGLYLVPKYVPPSELGAVMPLASFASFLALPISVFATTFRNELSTLISNKEFGKVKTLMRSVFIATGIFLAIALLISKFILPLFLERIRVAEGSLALLILAASFLGAASPVFSCALQALKKFKTNLVINLLSAPIRLGAMLLTMPLRAISGYFVGQASVPAFTILGTIIGLKKELSVPAEPYWTKDIAKRFSKLFLIFGAAAIASSFSSLVETTIIRQRLCELDSAGYYMATRFSDIASFLYCTLVFTIYPITAEMAACGKDTRPLVIKSSIATIIFCVLIAIPFFFFGEKILSLLPNGNIYSAYWWAIPWLIAITGLNAIIGLYTTAEISANRFRFMFLTIPINILNGTLLLCITGHGYFTNILPHSVTNFLSSHNITSLTTMLWWLTGSALLQTIACIIDSTKSITFHPKAIINHFE